MPTVDVQRYEPSSEGKTPVPRTADVLCSLDKPNVFNVGDEQRAYATGVVLRVVQNEPKFTAWTSVKSFPMEYTVLQDIPYELKLFHLV